MESVSMFIFVAYALACACEKRTKVVITYTDSLPKKQSQLSVKFGKTISRGTNYFPQMLPEYV